MIIQQFIEACHRVIELVPGLLRKQYPMNTHKCGINWSKTGRTVAKDRVEQSHDALSSTRERDRNAKGFGVKVELLKRVRSCQDSKVVIQSPCCRRLFRCFSVPMPTYAGPNLPVANVIVLNGHTISAKVTKTFDPGIFKSRHSFI
ncbi:unnamed protein product [Fusarium graminearum]|nr:unnamed protein product [Fusarium graminearum]